MTAKYSKQAIHQGEKTMKKHLIFVIAGLFLFALVSASVSSATVQEDAAKKIEGKKILEKMIEAMGGREALAKVKDTTTSGNMSLVQMGMDGSVTMYQKEPNLMRMDMELMGMVITQAYDGKTAWYTNPQTGANEEMTEDQALDMQRQALGNAVLLDPDKYGIAFTSEGKETIEGKDYDVLVQTYPDGKTITLFLDPQTYFVYKSKTTTVNQMGAEVEAETFSSDYKKFEGVMVPYSITIYQDGEEFMTLEITEVKFNTGLEDSFFKMNGGPF